MRISDYRKLELWKRRQEKEGVDVSNVRTLEEAKHFYDEKEPEREADGTAEQTGLEKMKKPELQAVAMRLGLEAEGTKAELIERIKAEQGKIEGEEECR